MVIESLGLYYHIECFRCYVCNIPLSSSFEGTDVRVRSNRLHCQNCFSDENGKTSSFFILKKSIEDSNLGAWKSNVRNTHLLFIVLLFSCRNLLMLSHLALYIDHDIANLFFSPIEIF